MDEALEGLLIDGLDDWTAAGWIVSELCIREQEETPPLDEVREAVLAAVATLLEGGLIEVGDLVGDSDALTFVPWPVAPFEVVDKVRRDWEELGRLPGLWELFWLRNTPAGDEVARAALTRDG